jgi:hypothetical protein
MGFLLQCTLKKKNRILIAGLGDHHARNSQKRNNTYGIFVAVYIKKQLLIAGLEIMRAIPRRGIHKWDFRCSVHKKKNPDCRAGDHARYLVPRPLLAARAIPRRGIHNWEFCCSVGILIAGLEIMRGTWFHDLSWQRAIPRRGKHKWDFRCSVH